MSRAGNKGFHVPEKGKTFSGEEREETVAWNKETYNLLKQAEKGEVKSYVQDTALCGHGLPRNSHKPRGLHRPDESKGHGWTGKTAINTSHSQTLKGRAKGKTTKSATINWKSIMRWTLERRV